MSTVPSASESPVQAQSKQVKRGCLFYVKRGLLALVIVLIALPILGFTYETIMSAGDAERYPAPSQLLDVGGYRLHLYCVGEGSPTVILTYGFADNSLTWSSVQDDIAEQAGVRVCAWDRAGLGWSDALPQQRARTPSDVSAELHTLLAEADIPSPYLMVGHSLGGIYARMYAIQHPDEVAGVVLLDSSHETANGDSAPKSAEELAQPPAANGMYGALVRLGVIRLFGQSLLTGLQPAAVYLPESVRPTYLGLTGQMKTIQAWANEEAGMTQDDALLEANSSLGDRPLAVLVSSEGIENNDGWQPAQETMAAASTNSRLQIVPDSVHLLQWQYPEVVTQAVVDVVESVRTGEPLAQEPL